MKTIPKKEVVGLVAKGKADRKLLKTEKPKPDQSETLMKRVAENIQHNTEVAISLVKLIEKQKQVQPNVEVNVPEAVTVDGWKFKFKRHPNLLLDEITATKVKD